MAKQLGHEIRCRARQNDGSTAQSQVNFHDHGAHTVTGTQVFFGDHFGAAQAAFNSATLHNHVALIHAFDGAYKNLFATRHKVAEQHFTLSIANFLQDDLLGCHGANAANGHRLDGLFYVLIHLNVRNLLLSFKQQNFLVWQLKTRLVGHHMPALKRFVFAGISIHRDPNIHITRIKLFGRLG